MDASKNRTLSVAGPADVSPLEAVRTFERASGQSFTVDYVPQETLLQKLRSAAGDPLEETFAALMLDYANGCPMDMRETLAIFPMRLTSLQEYADSMFRQEHAHA